MKYIGNDPTIESLKEFLAKLTKLTLIGGEATDVDCPECNKKLVTAEFGDANSDISVLGLQCDDCGYTEEIIHKEREDYGL